MVANTSKVGGKRHIAIVGSGPSGFYAAEALLQAGADIAVDMYERLPVPFGLVRFGVAPDHAKLKSVATLFTRIGQMPGFRFFGNIEIGRDVSVEDLRLHYDGVIFALGAEREKALGIPSEDLAGSHSARAFVAWYNGHPDYRDLDVDLNCETAVIIGHGNVSLDAARILVKPVDELRKTDISDHALEVLAESRIKSVHIVGRRGPAQAKFTSKELREFGTFETCDCVIDPSDLELGSACLSELEEPSNMIAKSNIELFSAIVRNEGTAARKCHFDFYGNPVRMNGISKVSSIIFERTRLDGEAFRQRACGTGDYETLECGLVIRCIGYQVHDVPGLPVNPHTAVLDNVDGRLVRDGAVMPGLYATGWAKRGPSGTIGVNRGDSVATVENLLEDLAALPALANHPDTLTDRLAQNGTKIVGFPAWEKIDAVERALGVASDRPRRKLTKISDMLKAAELIT